MSQELPANDSLDFFSAQSGFTNRLASRFGLLQPQSRRFLRILLLILVTWVPLLVLAGMSGHVALHSEMISLFRDPEVNCRFLITIPLLELAEAFLASSLTIQARQLLNCGIISSQQRPQFEAIRDRIRQWHQTSLSEAVLFAIAVVTSIVFRMFVMSSASPGWERQGGVLTSAGWWHMLVSLPLLYFFLLRAIWVFTLWTLFLYRVSRLNLQLTPTHPDHAGGLGFLAWSLASFAPTALSFSTVVSAGFAYEIYHGGESLNSLKYHLIVYVILMTVIIHLPVIPFASRLTRCRFLGLLEFSSLAWRHDRAFDEKWIHQPQSRNQEKLLGTADVQSLADMGAAYEHVENMSLIPIDYKSAMAIAIASALPMLPLIGTEIPLQEIISKLGELLI